MGPCESVEVANNNSLRGQRDDSVISLFAVRWLTVILAVGLVVAGGACSMGQNSSGDSWMRGYLDDPDRVWNASLMVLDDLGYDLEEEDRIQGTIRAVAVDDGPYKGMVLKIDQVMRTDIVRVHVHAGDTGGGQQTDVKKLDAAASAFLAAMDQMLGVK